MDTKPKIICELGLCSNCTVRGEIHLTYRCDGCGFNHSIHMARLEKIHTQGLKPLKGRKEGLRGLILHGRK